MILEALFPRLKATAAPDDDFWYSNPASIASSGAKVTPDTSLQVSAVLACVSVLAQTLASVPLHIYETLPRGRRKATDYGLYEVLHSRPNQWQTSFEFREMMMGHLCLRGNAYAQIIPGELGSVTSLIPLHPDRVAVEQLDSTRLLYTYTQKDTRKLKLSQENVFHIRWFSHDGLTGMSPIAVSANAVGLAMSSESYGAKFFKNVGRPGGVLKMPPGQRLKDDGAYNRLRESWKATHGGENMHSVAILEDGMEWQQIGLTNQDAEWIASRSFQTIEICRIFRVPPHMVADLTRATFSNIENQDIGFVKHTMLPWFRRWEDSIARDLIEDPGYFAKFAMDGLLRGDSASRSAFFRELFGIGVLSINDIREYEELDAIDGGDIHFVPLNMVPLDRVDDQFNEQVVAPEPTPQEEPEEETASPSSPGPAEAWIDDVADRLAAAMVRDIERRVGKAADDRERFCEWITGGFTAKYLEAIPQITARLHAAHFPGRAAATTAALITAMVASAMRDSDDHAALLDHWRTALGTKIGNLLKGYLYDEP